MVKAKAVDAAMANVLPAVLAPNPEETALPVAPTQVSQPMVHRVRKPPAVAAQSVALAIPRLLACPTTTLITNPQRITKKMISNRAPMHT